MMLEPKPTNLVALLMQSLKSGPEEVFASVERRSRWLKDFGISKI